MNIQQMMKQAQKMQAEMTRRQEELAAKTYEAHKRNIETYLRIGFAYLQTNKIKNAKKYYLQALKPSMSP